MKKISLVAALLFAAATVGCTNSSGTSTASGKVGGTGGTVKMTDKDGKMGMSVGTSKN